jgi:hypothetical protein
MNEDSYMSDGENDMDSDCSQKNSENSKGKKGTSSNNRSFMMNENGNMERIIRKRKRKSGDQLKTLMREFDRNPNWSKETLLEVSRKTGLSEA